MKEDKSQPIHIMLASDTATSAGLAVAGFSAIKRTSRPLELWVIQEGLEPETIHALRSFWSDAAEIHFLKMMPVPWWWETEIMPLLTWARIQLGELLPDRVGRCIWLDTDVLVGRDLAELWDMPLQGNSIAMAINDKMPPEVVAYVRSIGIDPTRWHNAGVQLIDVDAWRRGSTMTELMRCKRALPPVLWFHDQDLLNKYFAGRILTLDPSWNRRDVAYSPEGQLLHFAGSPKPWEIEEDSGYKSLRAWREVYAYWGRPPGRKRKSKVRLKSASAVRRLLSIAPWLLREPRASGESVARVKA
ncbi:glycosyltransferase family 8 protein [Candidatus Binatus sp.]|uniref:glycosyltransferase family 8 protein n=1 Tax=Candidatus Binatus sp. TaxID=2811406 RepID=UPI003C77606A